MAQFKERLIEIQSLNGLTEEKREEARRKAVEGVVGPEIDEANYPPAPIPPPEPSEYPNAMVMSIVILCVVVLIAAFIPSAYRMYTAGSEVFCKSFDEFVGEETDAAICSSVGVATVLMAETGQAVALLAIAVLGTTALSGAMDLSDAQKRQVKATKLANSVFWFVAILTTAIAYVGNLHVAKPWTHMDEFFGAFAWLLDLAPPTLVIGIMYAMKELMLYFIRRRFQHKLQIAATEKRRLDQIAGDHRTREGFRMNPEVHPLWHKQYALALKDAIVKSNLRQRGERKSKALDARLYLLKNLSNEEWKYLIKQQIIASDFTVDPTKLTVVERIEAQLEQEEAEAIAESGEEVVREITAEDIVTVEEPVYQLANGKWGFKGKGNYKRENIKDEKTARKAYKTYMYHWNRRNGS